MNKRKRIQHAFRGRWIKILRWMKQSSLPGFGGIPAYDVLAFVIRETGKDDITTRANSAAFSFFLSIFPSLLFLITLLPYYPFGQEILALLEYELPKFLPGMVGDFIIDSIQDLKVPRGGLLSFGIIAALYFASNGMDSLFRGFEKYNVAAFRKRSWWERRLVAITMTLVLYFLLLATILLLIVGEYTVDLMIINLNLGVFSHILITLFRYVLVLGILFLGISVIYKYGPAQKKRTKLFSPGALLATLFCILSTAGFGFFIDNYSQYNQLYGAISALIIAMLWIQIICFVILIGFELNASVAVGKYHQEIME